MIGPKTKRSLISILSAIVTLPPMASMAAPPAASPAAPAAAPAAAGASGIDIKAEEQDFAGDHIIARGHVRVLYQDTVVIAPVATLYRDLATGQPQKAVFTGHPHLVQGSNKIDADVLTFEMASSKIIAEGHAHSEVENAAPPAETVATPITPMSFPAADAARKAGRKVTPAASAEAALAQAAATKGSLNQQGEEISKVSAGAAGAGGAVSSTSSAATSIDTESGSTSGSSATSASAGTASGAPGAAVNDGPTTIITDSDKQIYERSAGQFEATGHVKVKAGDIDVKSDHLRMAYGIDRKPEAAVFTGRANATQGQNNTQSDNMTYFLNTKRLQATGHVRSKVIQSSNSTATKSDTVTAPINEGKVEPIVNGGPKNSSKASSKDAGVEPLAGNTITEAKPGTPIIIISDTQDNNKETGRLDAVGNCKIFYDDTIGIGPKVIMVRNAYGQAEKVIFIGRSQVTQPGKRWIGDRITMTIGDHKVLAEGNTKAFIVPKKGAPPAQVPANPFAEPEFRLAGKNQTVARKESQSEATVESKISTTRVERPE